MPCRSPTDLRCRRCVRVALPPLLRQRTICKTSCEKLVRNIVSRSTWSITASVLSFSGASGGAKNVDRDDDLFTLPLPHSRSGSPPNIREERFAVLAGLDAELGLESDAEMDLSLDWEYQPSTERAPGDLWFEEDADAETVGGSQEYSQELLDEEGGLCFSDDDSASGDVLMPGLEMDGSNYVAELLMEDDFDDLWASSQSTLDDDGTLEWEDYSCGSSQCTNAEGVLPNASCHPDVFLADDVENEEDWLDNLASAYDYQLERGNDSYAQTLHSVSRTGACLAPLVPEALDSGLQLVYPAELELSLDDADDLAIESAPNANLPGSCAVVDTLEGGLATSYLPVPLSGDPTCALDGSRSPPGPAAVPSRAPFAVSALHRDLGERPDGRERRSPDGEKLSLRF
ncbi:hypothetical protein FKP32DRAFT_1275094 [Trametes sanguinea]|nr:hypothetical protein FKP32DRAFT_1275094 [Trametes sanguinea]